eukprot:7228853-Alexandrium_andersonii.AAC.1
MSIIVCPESTLAAVACRRPRASFGARVWPPDPQMAPAPAPRSSSWDRCALAGCRRALLSLDA